MPIQMKSLGLAIGLATLAITGAAGYWVASDPPGLLQQEDVLGVDPAGLNIGDVWENDKFQWDLSLVNRKMQNLNIRGFHASCGCVSVNPRETTIYPGQETTIHLV